MWLTTQCIILISFKISQVLSNYITQDVISLFNKEKCIEAALLTLPKDSMKNVMLDKDFVQTGVNLLNTSQNILNDKNSVSKINELAQYNEIEYSFELISEEGPAHSKIFKVALKLGDEKYESSSTSLKTAKQQAAALALENTNYKTPPKELKEAEEKIVTPTVVLNNVAMKLGISVSYYLMGDKEQDITHYHDSGNKIRKSYYEKLNESIYHSESFLKVPTEETQMTGPFSVRVKVGDFLYKGIGHTIQAARHDAASKALKEMEKQALLRDNVCSMDESAELCREKRESLKSPVNRIYESAQKHSLDVEFTVTSESGKSHKKVFITECRLGKFKTEGTGKSKKESKKDAAQKMLMYLKFLPETYSEKQIIGKSKKKTKKRNKLVRISGEKSQTSIISDMVASLWNSNERDEINNDNNKNKKGPKETILEVSNLLNIEIQFLELNQISDKFYSLISIAVQPAYVCLGADLNGEKSQDSAALHGLKLLQKSGLLDKLDYKNYKEDINEWQDEVINDHEREFYRDDNRDKF